MKAILFFGVLTLCLFGADLPELNSTQYTIKEFDRATTCPKCGTNISKECLVRNVAKKS